MAAPELLPVHDRPLVSYFVTGYNQADTIREAVGSALAQTYSPLEILLADDCSSDATFQIMQELAAAYEGPHEVRALRTPGNRGIVGNVNHVMAESRGELIVMAGGDDVSLPIRTERLVEAWLASGRRAHLLHSGAERIDQAGRVTGTHQPNPSMTGETSPLRVLDWHHGAALGATLAWSRALFERFGPLPAQALVEDFLLSIRGALLGPILYVDEPLVRWRVGGVSDRARAERRREALYGVPLRMARWRAGACLCAISDLEKVEIREKTACRRVAARQAEFYGLQDRLAATGHAGRLALMPAAAGAALRHRSVWPLATAFKYLFDGPYLAYWRLRYGIGDG
jgi:GT2 family glycosyltransferase